MHLHLQQVRHFEHAITATEALADALAFGVAVRGCLGHEISGQRHGMGSSTNCPLKKRLGLAVGHYQPMADGDALHIARTKASSVVGWFRRH